jgi:hypothetical protein
VILTVLCLSAASCSSTPRVVANLEEPDQALMQPHPPAPLLDLSRPLLLGDLLLADQELAGLYNELRIKHEGLAKYIRTLFARVKAGTKPP